LIEFILAMPWRLHPSVVEIDVINAAVGTFSRVFCPTGPVLEIGSYYQSGYDKWCDRRPLFPDVKYIGCDIRSGPGVDRIEDAQDLTFSDSSFGAVILLETLEHLPRPERAIAEACRVLRDDGLLLLSMPFNYRLHGFPSDYWRFTPSGLYQMLDEFQWKSVFSAGPRLKPATVFAIASKKPSGALAMAQQKFQAEMQSQTKPLYRRLFWCALHDRGRDLLGLLLGRAAISVTFFDPVQPDAYHPAPQGNPEPPCSPMGHDHHETSNCKPKISR
jgi:SAM-dependent methyltransferase